VVRRDGRATGIFVSDVITAITADETGVTVTAAHSTGDAAPVYLADARRRIAMADGAATVVHGAANVARAAHDLQHGARHVVRSVVAPPLVSAGAFDAVERAQLREGVGYHVIYDRAALTIDDQLERATVMVEHGERARIGSALPMKLMLVDGVAGIVPLATADGAVRHAVLVNGPQLVTELGQIFEDLWRAAEPFGAVSTEPVLVPSEQDRLVLSLLASGATDETIGRLMGSSARTAHRRVRELIARLGVQTRFQAGMRAVHLGWL